MKLDAAFAEDGHEYGIALEGGTLNVFVDGVRFGGMFVGILEPIPETSVIVPDPEPEIESVEAL